MLRRSWWLAAVFLVVAGAASTYGPPKKGDRLVLFFTATVNGNIEPCGCPVNPSGGLPRRARYIREHTPIDHAAVLLDGGDVVGPPTEKGLLETEYLFQGMREMGYTAIGLGARDFVFGVDFLRAAQHDYGFTFTSANLVGSDGAPLFPRYAVVKAGRGHVLGIPFGGQTVGVISAMGSDVQPVCPTCDPPLHLLDPFESVTKTAAEIRPTVDLVVVLACTGQEEIERFLTIPQVDVVIASRTLYPPDGFDNVGMHGRVALGYTAYEGRRLGVMRVERDQRGGVTNAEGDLEGLGEDMPDDPILAEVVAAYRNERARLPADSAEADH